MKKRMLSFLLALLMVVSIFPARAYATDSTDVTITPTETPTEEATEIATETACPTCGTVGCASEHLTWCADCKKDDCGQNHVFCEICQVNDCGKEHKTCETCAAVDCTADHTNWCAECKKDDCGVDHNATEPTEAPANEIAVIDDGENTSPYHANIGRKAQFDLTYSHFPIVSDPAGITSGDVFGMDIAVSKDVIPADMIVKIADCYVNEAEDIYWYKIEAAEGYSLPAEFPAPAWVFQDNVSYSGGASLILLDEEPENPCGCCDSCTGAEGCECKCGNCIFCEKEPENPCECGCDSCTGAEGCECKCGECDFCEKKEEPTVPSISATVNGQTVTVSGEALPEGATLEVHEVISGLDAGFVYDIKILDADGNEWQPTRGETVRVTIPVTGVENGCIIDVVHILEDEQLILEAVEKGNVLDGDNVETTLAAAAQAYKNAIGEGGAVAYEAILGLTVENSCVSFDARSFSIYTWSGSSFSRSSAGAELKIVMRKNAATDGANGNVYYVTNTHSIYMDRGGYTPTGQSWTTSNSSIGSFSGSNTDKYFNLNGTASLGTTFTITYSVKTDWSGAKSSTITLVIVEERALSYNANGYSVTPPSSVGWVTTGPNAGSYTHVSPSSTTIQAPTGIPTGYKFDYWTDESGNKYYSGNTFSINTSRASTTLYANISPINYTIKFNANGGTGSMASQTMTYGKAAALNENLFTPKPGYVFAGWSTSATGSVNYSDKQSVSNLASTQDAVVNLYAVWVNTMAFEDVRIGLNESYWFTNFMYTVTADGVASSSYHAFPAEPAKQAIRHTRASKDANGNWVISADDILPGTASAYIDPSIVYSNLFRYSVVASDTTRGVADPTGANVKAFLKFTNADYTAMIKVWLQSMADRTADTPNADGTYNVENRGATYKTDVNWNEEVDNWEEYEVIPYVIKMENYNCWRIDMIIAPMRYLTLSYDLNINTAIGYSLTGGSSIPNTQYERDTTQNVLASPHAYNSNIEVSKTVNGVKYTAEFLYWEDEQGIKYGTGYNSTVLMDGHKNLKAIWRYPDQTMGSLRVEKDVTVPVNTGLTPDTSKAFTITVELGTNGSYPYTKYSSTGIVTETSSFTGTTKSFTLKADEYVIITGINQGTTYTVSETAPTGYTNKSGTITGTIQAGNTMPATIVNENSSYTESFDFNGGSNTNTSVTVVYGSTNYFDVSWLKPTRTGHKFLGWFTAKEGGTQVYTDEGICIDGAYWSSKKWIGTADLPLFAHWEEEKYTVTFVDDDGTTILSEAEYDYGTPAASIVKPANPTKDATAEYTYTFAGWTPEVVAVTGDATYKATYTPVKNKYTITWLNDDGSLIDTTTVEYGKVPTHADPSKAATAEYTYTFAGWTPEVVAVTGKASYKATYTAVKNKYTITWKNEDGTVLETDTVEYGATPSYDGETPTKEPYNQYTYTFRAWSPEIVAVTGDAIYIASFYPHENFYTVTWVNHNDEVLETDENVKWDSMPEYNGDTPEKTGNAQFSYTFAGWSPTVSKVNGHATYTATFTESINDYTVTWKNEDGTVLETDENVVYGAMPSYDGETPEKAATAQYTYTFDGWDKEVVAVTGDVTYTAKFSATVNKYTVTFVDEDGTTILKEATEYEYGTAAEDIVKPANPTKEATAAYTYTFAGWTPEIAEVTANVTYKATYTEVKNQYTLSGEIDHGTVTDSVTVNYGTQAKITFTPAVGYKFYSWKVNDGAATLITTPAATWSYEDPQLTESKHVVVTMAPIEYTITYYLREGNLGEGITNPGTYTVETETFALNNPTKTGYKFVGWATSENADTGNETVTIEKGTTGDKTFYAIWERSLVDLTIKTTSADQEQSFIFTVSGTPSDLSYGTITLDVVLVGTDSITIKDLPVGEYTVTEKDGWSWRENAVESKTADLRTTSQTVSFDFYAVDDLHWLSGYSYNSYKRKKGGS